MEEENILKIIEDCYLNSKKYIEEDCFHHNTRYKDALLCLKHGILSAEKQKVLSLKEIPVVNLYGIKMPISNVNGLEYVSLARVYDEYAFGDKDLYIPYMASDVDIVIDKKLCQNFCVFHSSENYSNEFLVKEGIVPNVYFKSLNIRFHDMIRALMIKNKNSDVDKKEIFISNFLYLLEICKLLDYSGLNIDLCEVDHDGFIHDLDIKKLSKISVKL